jgi:NAD(P)-dependent dehydrogenase (short-subunit alcohol dehydrogenase family)
MKQADLFDVRGHVALVTGAASGLNLAYAEVMAENGATVIMVDLNETELANQTARLVAAGCGVESAALDVADTDALRAAVDGAARRHGRLDVLLPTRA